MGVACHVPLPLAVRTWPGGRPGAETDSDGRMRADSDGPAPSGRLLRPRQRHGWSRGRRLAPWRSGRSRRRASRSRAATRSGPTPLRARRARRAASAAQRRGSGGAARLVARRAGPAVRVSASPLSARIRMSAPAPLWHRSRWSVALRATIDSREQRRHRRRQERHRKRRRCRNPRAETAPLTWTSSCTLCRRRRA